MSQLLPYAGGHANQLTAVEPEPDKGAGERRELEAENKSLRDHARHLERAMRAAGKILRPYLE